MDEVLKTAAVIVAAGRGTRMGAGLPKQWRTLRGRTVTAWTLAAFRDAPAIGPVVLVLHPDDMDLAAGYLGHSDVVVAEGGATRAASVLAGLEALEGQDIGRVLIHDVARPLVSRGLIDRVLAALDGAAGAAPALAVTDALWTGADGHVTGTQDRANLWRAQTPQGFHFAPILAAHRAQDGDPADDVAVARAAGLDVAIVAGDENNIKITGPEDLARAEVLMGHGMDIRCGNGFDVHAFGPGDRVVLCGLSVPHSRGLTGHSDADVALHAITDAIYGALGAGDIGRHFPPSETRWKGARSDIFLDHALQLCRERGFAIGHLDLTLICEAPKIAPHADEMTQNLAAMAGVAADRVSVKATTTEGLGFAGRQEGIAALATATLTAG